MKTLIFNIWGQWGHFRTYYTTSSPLTFSIIPPTSAFGVIGAILGLSKEKNEYLKILNEANTKIAVSLDNEIKKTRMGVNLIDTKHHFWKIHNRTQIRTEYLRDAKYKIFVTMDNEILMNTLIQRVREHKTYYTVSLGLSEMIADFAFVDEIDFISNQNNDYVDIHSIIPMSSLPEQKGIQIEEGKWYKKEMLPINMDDNRVVHKYEECLFEMKAKPIKAKPKNYWSGGNYNVIFLNI